MWDDREPVTIVQWKSSIGGRIRNHRVTFVPGYGMTCSGMTTNGNWWDTAQWMLSEIVMAPYAFNREGFDDKMVVDTSTIPPEILTMAEAYKQHCLTAPRPSPWDLGEWNRSLDPFIRPAIDFMKKLVEGQGFTWDDSKKDWKWHWKNGVIVYERNMPA